MTKKLLIILLIVVIASGAILGFFWWQEKGGIQRVDWKTYRNEEYGFEVKYPEDWIVETKQIPVYPDTFTVMVELTAPLKDKQVFIAIRPKGDEGMIRKSFSIISEEKININGVTSSKITGVGQKEGFPRETFILVTRGPYLYQLKGEGEIFDQILSTFRFIEPSEIDTSNWKTYRNEEYGYEVKYPEDWEFVVSTTELAGSPSFESLFFTRVPPEGVRVVVGVTQIKSEMDWREQAKEGGLVPNVYKSIIINGKESLKLTIETEESYSEEISFLDDTGTRIITFYLQSTRANKERYINIFNQMLSTFKLIE